MRPLVSAHHAKSSWLDAVSQRCTTSRRLLLRAVQSLRLNYLPAFARQKTHGDATVFTCAALVTSNATSRLDKFLETIGWVRGWVNAQICRFGNSRGISSASADSDMYVPLERHSTGDTKVRPLTMIARRKRNGSSIQVASSVYLSLSLSLCVFT